MIAQYFHSFQLKYTTVNTAFMHYFYFEQCSYQHVDKWLFHRGHISQDSDALG